VLAQQRAERASESDGSGRAETREASEGLERTARRHKKICIVFNYADFFCGGSPKYQLKK
jgi:hypothetical protein